MPQKSNADHKSREGLPDVKLQKNEIKTLMQNYAMPYRELMSYYRCAMMEVETKFNVLNEELSLQYDRNPIETIKTRLVERKDYIANPKSNGYRSLHLIVEIPIFLHDHKRLMRVEVQFRTISMDWWASLEHKIRYKKGLQESDHVDQELFECAKMSAELDSRMEKLQQFVGDLYE